MKSRAPIWDAQAWLENNYRDRNGLPNFFREGGYTFAMKETAEEDYIMVVDAAANQQENESFQLWAINMKINQYRALQLTTTLEYWRYLAEKEKDALSRDKAAGLTLASCRTASERPVKSPRNTYLSSDTIFVEGYRESFGTIVGRFGRSYISHNNKSSYFKTLAMNNIIDLSDDSEGSHLAQVNPEAQNAVKELLHKSPINEDEVDSQCQVFEKLIKKVSRLYYRVTDG
ncbi:uncharacterized protein BYT42DRAFT_80923 [Radiomyces spectabilis]|uniref:uncharacterized protein n=1 Tax=Radiomyces spectabilis TaxID=64574 RepID=UPI00221E9C51|nr:uncharacterized protein BYT42DRAFT_80923 [Radiomyces spectabilis]KAI8371762.1 hypothetical protein BYT42DRAFT_80923 [Radiomyces spectabilis]